MKLSKKILGAVLCGLIVVGGSNATLVKANAQTSWSERVCFGTHTKGFNGFTDVWGLDLTFENGQLQLKGRTNIPLTVTFDDTFKIGWHRQYEPGYYYPQHIVFRDCWQARASDALRKAEEIFNSAHLQIGDEIFIYGENSNTSVRFSGPYLITQPQSRISYNTQYNELYKMRDKHHTALKITESGLQTVNVSPYI